MELYACSILQIQVAEEQGIPGEKVIQSRSDGCTIGVDETVLPIDRADTC